MVDVLIGLEMQGRGVRTYPDNTSSWTMVETSLSVAMDIAIIMTNIISPAQCAFWRLDFIWISAIMPGIGMFCDFLSS